MVNSNMKNDLLPAEISLIINCESTLPGLRPIIVNFMFQTLTCIAMSYHLKFFIIKSLYHYLIILVVYNVGNNKLTLFYVARNRAGQLRLSFHF